VPDTKPSLLIVDDLEANLVALEGVLNGMGCEIVFANSGNEALRQLLKRDFAAILLDVQMPGMDGYEVAAYARGNPATRDVPIIFLTAMYKTEERVLRGYGTGAVDFLFKPVNADILRSKVRVFLDLYLGKQTLANEVAAHRRTLLALKQANAALRHFTEAASHDLRAPLRSIKGFLEALDERVGSQIDAESYDYLTRSRRASERMDALLRSLLSYAQLQKPPEFAPVKCQQLLEQVKTDLTANLTASGAVVELGDLPAVRGDAERLYQLFMNVIGNANKFHAPGKPPRIRVSARLEASNWVFCVEDNGIGVDASEQRAIFEAFHRLHPRAAYEGSGLGLMICSQIVEQHGGLIWVESEPGQGCRFYFSLPTATEMI
jgi:signal transduction histidine kinase